MKLYTMVCVLVSFLGAIMAPGAMAADKKGTQLYTDLLMEKYMLGLGTAHLIKIPVNSQGEMDMGILEAQLEKTLQLLSVTLVTNTCIKAFPVNSIHNPCTRYEEITDDLDHTALETLWGFMKQIGRFRMARVGVKADNLSALIRGRFHVVEINLFLPMPMAKFFMELSSRCGLPNSTGFPWWSSPMSAGFPGAAIFPSPLTGNCSRR